jgi:hypothetical protein
MFQQEWLEQEEQFPCSDGRVHLAQLVDMAQHKLVLYGKV